MMKLGWDASGVDTKLRKLLELVEDRSEHGRNLLFRHVCDLFFHGPLPAEQTERDALFDVLRILLPRTDLSVRRELAGHLYSMERPPEPLLRLLIEDEPAVADIILDYAPLPEPLLRELAVKGNPHIVTRLLARPGIAPTFRAMLPEHKPQPAPKPEQPTTAAPKPVSALLPDMAPFREVVGQAFSYQDQLADFSRASSDWLWETDRDGRVIYLSDEAATGLGASLSVLSGQRLQDLFVDSRGLEDRLGSWRPFDGLKLQAHAVTGVRNWVLGAVPTFDLVSGRFTGYRGTATNAMEDRVASVSPIRAIKSAPAPAPISALPPAHQTNQANQLHSALAQGVTETLQTLSHEIRTPLNAIIGFSELIELGASGPVNDDYKKCLRKIQAAGHHLNEFVTEILEDARLRRDNDESKLRSVVSAHLIRSAIEAVNRHAAVRAITIIAAPHPHETILVTDPQIAERCLVRLLRSAIAEVADGSVIAIETRQLPGGAVAIVIPISDRQTSKHAPALAGAPDTEAVNALKTLRLEQIRALASRIGAVAQATATGFSLHLPAAEARDTSPASSVARSLIELSRKLDAPVSK